MGNDVSDIAQSPHQRSEREPVYCTQQEAALRLGVSITVIRDALRDGRLAFTHQYARKLIRVDELEEYQRRTQPQHLSQASEEAI